MASRSAGPRDRSPPRQPRPVPASRDDDSETTLVDRKPAFEPSNPGARMPLDELFDAVETGSTGSRRTPWMSLTAFVRMRRDLKPKPRGAPPLSRVLGVRVRFGGLVTTARNFLLGAVLGAALLAFGVGVLVPHRAPPTPAPALPLTPPSSAPEPELTLGQRAALGDIEAIDALERQDGSRASIDELVAPTAGRIVLRRQVLSELGAELAATPARADEPAVRARLIESFDDPTLTIDALVVAARIRSSLGPDLLHQLATDPERSGEVRALAERLLQASSVREHASVALRLALDLARVERCSEAAGLLDEVAVHADERALPALQRLAQTTGCGDDEREDCFGCLRGAAQLEEVTESVRLRPAPYPLPRALESVPRAEPRAALPPALTLPSSKASPRRSPRSNSRDPGF